MEEIANICYRLQGNSIYFGPEGPAVRGLGFCEQLAEAGGALRRMEKRAFSTVLAVKEMPFFPALPAVQSRSLKRTEPQAPHRRPLGPKVNAAALYRLRSVTSV